MSQSHTDARKKHTDRIKTLTTDDIATFEPHEVMQWAIYHGVASRIGEWLDKHGNTVNSWAKEPGSAPQPVAQPSDPYGRNGPLAYFFGFFLTVMGCSPEGAGLILRWLTIKYAEEMAAQGHPELLTAVEANEEIAELAQRILVLSGAVNGRV